MIDRKKYNKLPRLYISGPIREGRTAPLSANQAHYLLNVLRRDAGTQLRLFNGKDGEWLCSLDFHGRRQAQAVPLEPVRAQAEPGRKIHLLFTPIKKQRMDFLIEKAVELGATDMHPVITQNTEIRKVNRDRLENQITEAAEQCERLDIPMLHDPEDIRGKLSGWKATDKVMVCLERLEGQASALPGSGGDVAVLTGPEGGFTEEERAFLTDHSSCALMSLGGSILRSETAALAGLVKVQAL